jgi:hypothetical protein
VYTGVTYVIGVIMPTTVYTSALINAWQLEASQLNGKIPQYRQVIEERRAALIPMQNRLRSVQSELDTVQSSITWAEINQAQDRRNHHHHYHNHHHYRPTLLHTLGDIAAAGYLSSLYARRSTLHATRAQIRADMQPHESTIEVNQRAMEGATTKVTQLNAQISAGTSFLHTLSTNPALLVAQLKSAISTAFQGYNDNHPLGLSLQVRMCLYDIQNKLNSLTVQPKEATLAALQLNYLDLCAMLQNMYAKVEEEEQDLEFKGVLFQLLENTHIATNGDLPDLMQTGQSTTTRFAFIAGVFPQFSIDPGQFLALEAQCYTQKLSDLENGIFVGEEQKRIKAVIDSIKAEVEAKKIKNEFIDYRFYTRILADMWQVINHRQDSASIQHLGLLANAASGSPSIGKKVAGALTALVGFLLLTASIACLVATFGGSSLASGFGAALGISIIQSQICLGVSASVTAVAASGLGTWGVFKYKEGMRQGLSQNITNFQMEMEKNSPALA